MAPLIDWIRGFLYLLFFATLVQVVLPDDGVRRYTRLVVGLVMLAALLQPITDLTKNPGMIGEAFAGMFGQSNGAETADAWIAEGERLRGRSQDIAIRHMADRMSDQLEGMLLLIQGVAEVEVVNMELSEQGVHRVSVRLVGPESAAAEVYSVLHKFFGIPEDVVHLVWDEAEGR